MTDRIYSVLPLYTGHSARSEEDAAIAAFNRTDRDTLPVPVLSLGRTATSDPYGSANFIGLSAEIPLSDTRRGLMARGAADQRAAERFNQSVGTRIPVMRQMPKGSSR